MSSTAVPEKILMRKIKNTNKKIKKLKDNSTTDKENGKNLKLGYLGQVLGCIF